MTKKILLTLGIVGILGLAIMAYAANGEIRLPMNTQATPNAVVQPSGDDDDMSARKAISIQKLTEGKEAPSFDAFKKLHGDASKKVEYKASNGDDYLIFLPSELIAKEQQAIGWIEEQTKANQLIKQNLERPETERSATIAKIEDLFGNRNVAYQSVSGDPEKKTNVREEYTDNAGRRFTYLVDKNKVVRMQVGEKAWCENNKDILDDNCHFKAGTLTEDQAKEKALAFFEKALGDEMAKKVVAESELERAPGKGNTFVFAYPAKDAANYSILLVIEPVKGEVINYQNNLE
jgi:hypothetical protein